MINIGSWLLISNLGQVVGNSQGFKFNFGATGLNEIVQNCIVVLTTRVGTVQGDRQFGTNYQFVNTPMNAAELIIVANVCYALEHYEPRATFKYIQFAPLGVPANPSIIVPAGNLGALQVQLTLAFSVTELTLPSN